MMDLALGLIIFLIYHACVLLKQPIIGTDVSFKGIISDPKPELWNLNLSL